MWPETGPRVAMFPVHQMQKAKAPVLDFIILVLVEFSCRLHSQNAAKIAQSMLNLTPKKKTMSYINLKHTFNVQAWSGFGSSPKMNSPAPSLDLHESQPTKKI